MIYQYLVLAYTVFVLVFPKISLIQISNFATPVRLEDFLLLVLLGLLALRKNFLENFSRALSSPVSVLIIGWLSLVFVSTTYNVLFNQLPVSSYLFVLRFVEYAALFYLGYAVAPSKKFRSVCFKVLVAVGILVSAWALLQIMGAAGGFGGGFYQYTYIKGTDRAFASFSGPYELAGFLIVLIPITAALFMVSKKRRGKIFYLMALVAAIMAMGFSGARFPVICAFLAVLSLGLVRRELKYRLTVGALALMTLLMPFLVSDTLVLRFKLLAGTFEGFRKEEAVSQIWQEQEIQEEPKNLLEAEVEEEAIVDGEVTTSQEKVEKTFNFIDKVKERISVFVERVEERRRTLVKEIERRGSFLVGELKQADPSLGWRLGETWPRAMAKVRKNPLLGGGMGSVGVGLDGEYATLLGETGLLGLAVFIILLKKIVTEMLSKVRGDLLAFTLISITIGLAADAIFADIFRASKIAFLFWYLVGASLGLKEEEK